MKYLSLLLSLVVVLGCGGKRKTPVMAICHDTIYPIYPENCSHADSISISDSILTYAVNSIPDGGSICFYKHCWVIKRRPSITYWKLIDTASSDWYVDSASGNIILKAGRDVIISKGDQIINNGK
jgi:hypothetical protein